MKIKLRLLGGLKFVTEDQEIDLIELLGKQSSMIFAFLLVNRSNTVMKEKLIETFWEDSKNPLNAMKFAIFRLRKGLSELPFHQNEEWIRTNKGGYSLNLSLLGEVDIFAMEQLTRADQLPDFRTLIAMYPGPFLGEISDFDWIATEREHQWKVYVGLVEKVCQQLQAENHLEDAETLSKYALNFDAYDDSLNYLYLQALTSNKKYNTALKHFESISRSFYREYGIEFQGKSQSLIYFVSADKPEEASVKPQDFMNTMTQPEQQSSSSAFFCEMPVFQKMYQNKLKDSLRTGENVFLILMDLKFIDGSLDKDVVSSFLNKTIMTCLRSNDIYCRVTKNQFAMMLVMRQKEDTYLVIDRVSRRFYKKYPAEKVKLFYDVDKVEHIQQLHT